MIVTKNLSHLSTEGLNKQINDVLMYCLEHNHDVFEINFSIGYVESLVKTIDLEARIKTDVYKCDIKYVIKFPKNK